MKERELCRNGDLNGRSGTLENFPAGGRWIWQPDAVLLFDCTVIASSDAKGLFFRFGEPCFLQFSEHGASVQFQCFCCFGD